MIKTFALFALTAVAEIVGCYLPYLWLRQGKSIWLLVPAALSLGLFAWLLSLHPTAAGRVYAAYGGVYIGTAILWLWLVDKIRPTGWDLLGSAVALLGMAIIMFAPRHG
ncbi:MULTISPECIES: YnfA family protein [Pseudomonadaceae]|uniref:YnfA family protein n=1 Tax=Pseudomonas knackmussii TaxID=65741 RepID=A0ABY4KVT1_9PSED|nr:MULTISPECIES: YnfA family protein [Pseudomonas]UPQ84784.1 YnfA family protein [Pseudomonas knackmussii]